MIWHNSEQFTTGRLLLTDSPTGASSIHQQQPMELSSRSIPEILRFPVISGTI